MSDTTTITINITKTVPESFPMWAIIASAVGGGAVAIGPITTTSVIVYKKKHKLISKKKK